MSYAPDILTSEYLYIQEITITEKSGEDQTNWPIKLELNSSNFNFNFARSDGKDFRLGEASDGSYILNMWIAHWDVTNEIAAIYFKLPQISANEVKTLYAYWGNATDAGVSDPDLIGFMFFDHFDGPGLDSSKWGDNGGYTVAGSKVNVWFTNSYIYTKTMPISGCSWAVEDGFYSDNTGTAHINQSYRHLFTGTNPFEVYFTLEGDYDRKHNFVDGGSVDYDDGDYRGLELDSYHNNLIGYYEPLDRIYQGLSQRDTHPDYLDSWERVVSGNTRVNTFYFYGRYLFGADQGCNIYHDWVLIRKFLGAYEPEFDTSNLYVTHEQINPDVLEYDFGGDITHINFGHLTSSGGEPTKLSNNQYGTISDIWCSSDGAASGPGVNLTINFNTYGDELTDTEYLHYDSGHVLYLNASKLSDEDSDESGNMYWKSTTTSGWVCIDFGANLYNVGTVMVQGRSGNLGGMPKNYKIEGSYIYSNHWEDNYWHVLTEGQLNQSDNWQSIIFTNDVNYRFYRLKIIDTYGSNITLQEWRMYEYDESVGKKTVAKLNLKPAAFDSQYIYFPKQIEFYGSNDMYNWTTLINTKNTYTPTNGVWQEHILTTTSGCYHYKLKCIGNWNDNTGKLCVGGWEMLERTTEAYSYRILAGTSNNFGSIWADSDCTFDSGDFYVVNDVINYVEDNKLVGTQTFTGSPTDLNVI